MRVLLASVTGEATVGPGGPWRVTAGGRELAAGGTGLRWSVQRDGRRARVMRNEAPASPWVEGPIVIEPVAETTLVAWQGKTYRGALAFVPTDSALLVMNQVDVEEYLRGVLPLEIGARLTDDHAAVEAQAVAARSFTYSRMAAAGVRPFDVRATDADQVYGGTGVETFWGDLAVAATAGLVLVHRGRVVIGPYHAACGGSTAAPSEVWRGGQDDFLRPVSDTNPRTGEPWCAIAPRSRWERRLTRAEIASAMGLYSDVTLVPEGAMRVVRDVRLDGRSASGRVRAIVLATDAGDVAIRGNEIRHVLRPMGGEPLPSTSFEMAAVRSEGGELRELILRGRGNGHGVGLCQWGAIGRARAGEDFRAILKAYYPGADITRAP